jgi:hypothetical protein
MSFGFSPFQYISNQTQLSKNAVRRFNYVFCSEMEVLKRAPMSDPFERLGNEGKCSLDE